jgi:NAD(P)H-hydrate epimerase
MTRLTRQQVREVDRIAIERYRVPGVVLMENVARAAADVACDMLDDECVGQVLIACGGGNNGGDGLAIARHLHNRGAEVSVALTIDPAKFKGDALINWRIVEAMRLRVAPATPELIRHTKAVLLIDAVFGTGLSEAPRDPFPSLVMAIEQSRVPVLAIDIPSGLNCDTGEPFGPCVRATRTITFVAEKAGFASPAAQHYLGRVTVGDIGCPHEAIDAALRGAA